MRGTIAVALSLLTMVIVVETAGANREARREGRIVFIYGESGDRHPAQVAVMDADGKNRRDLKLDHVTGVAWAPGGRSIAYNRYPRDVYLIDVDGPPKPRILVRNGRNVDWAASGSALAFARVRVGDQTDIWTAETGGARRQHRVARNGDSPSWSPDGKRLAFVRGGDIWAVDVATKAARPLIRTPAGSERLARPRWSRDGGSIAFERIVQRACCGEESAVYIARADGTAQHRLGSGETPTWSPDGGEIAYAGPAGRFADAIVRVRPDGSNRRVVFGVRPYCGCFLGDWAP